MSPRSHAELDAEVAAIREDMTGLRATMRQIANQSLEHGRLLLDHAKLHTQHAGGIAASREDAREAKQKASEVASAAMSTAEAIDRHVRGLAAETKAQSAALSTLVRWQNSPWLKVAVVSGATVGGIIAGYLTAHGGH